MIHQLKRYHLVLILFLLSPLVLRSQFYKEYRPLNAGELKLALERLNTLGTALYLAAHPDDENTRLITYLTRHRHIRTGYLSLTRGDGGQNLTGSEKGAMLGVLRTQELLAARKIDGGLQFFTRANDFSYSKTAGETLEIWGEQKILSDIVWVIRKFKPDVIITRFPGTGAGGHGHHTASAILARKAFEAASEPSRFPDQLKYVDTWQPERLLFNTSWWFYRSSDKEFDPEDLLWVNVGKYNPLLGKSYTEIAGKSRSQHKSQGFGAAQTIGRKMEYLETQLGPKGEDGIFDGISLSWLRVDGGEKVQAHIQKAIQEFEPQKPEKIIPHLVRAYQTLKGLEDSYWKKVKLHELKNVIASANGLWLEALAGEPRAARGDSVEVNARIVKRGDYKMILEKIRFPFNSYKYSGKTALPYNQPFDTMRKIRVPGKVPYTQPYWLRKPPHGKGSYQIPGQKLAGLPVAAPATRVRFSLLVDGVRLSYNVPVRYRWVDPVEGERLRPFEVTPLVMVNISGKGYIFPGEKSKKVEMVIKAGVKNIKGQLKFPVPEGWKITPEKIPFEIEEKGEEKKVSLTVTPPRTPSVVKLKPVVLLERSQEKVKVQPIATPGMKIEEVNSFAARSMVEIEYAHIPVQTLFPQVQVKLLKVNLEKKGDRIGYIMGSGDEIPQSLRQIGYKVDLLNEADLLTGDLSKYDAIIAGIRVYNTQSWIKHQYSTLMDYIKNGGTYIVQYSKSYNRVAEKIGPYPFRVSHDRVTVEEAAVKMLVQDHPVLNQPNKITSADFEGWVHERGLYFADEWDDRYTPLFSSHDPGEDPQKGGMLYTKYGKGYFIYTGYSWFRQLPAGVPGAYRIFANMISLGN